MSKEIFRVDKFVVPAHAREEFLIEPRLVLCETPPWNKRLVPVNSTSWP